MPKIYIGFGSNLGNKKNNIKSAIGLLKEKCKILKASNLYRTEPLYLKNQDWFLNAAAECLTDLEPEDLLDFLKSVEKKIGRVKTIKHGPRIIDLDILFYGDKIINEKDFIVPHPKLHERLFVLVPLNELCSEFIHPVFKKSVKELISGIKTEQKIEKYNGLW